MINTPWKIFNTVKQDNLLLRHDTCNELKIVNIHANATVSSFIASNPNTQVHPSMGTTITAAFSNALKQDIKH